MALDIFADENATKMPAGTYTYATTKAVGTFGDRSCISLYNPSSSYSFAEGSTIKISYEGDNIAIELALITTDGRKMDMNYRGPIKFPATQALAKGARAASIVK